MCEKLSSYEWLSHQYDNLGRSYADIAKELGTYPQAIRRACKKLGIKPRNKSEAQKNALAQGTARHPTAGVRRSDAVRLKISEGVSHKWSSLSPEELKSRSDKSREQWKNMSAAQKQEMKELAGKAIRAAAKDGSKLEKSLMVNLTNVGYIVEYHKEKSLANQRLQLDIFLPEQSVAIEIDGPSHFLPIWGEDALRRTMRADLEKNGLLIINGVVVLRVKCLNPHLNVSQKTERDLFNAVITHLKEIEKNFPPPDKRIIEIEVN